MARFRVFARLMEAQLPKQCSKNKPYVSQCGYTNKVPQYHLQILLFFTWNSDSVPKSFRSSWFTNSKNYRAHFSFAILLKKIPNTNILNACHEGATRNSERQESRAGMCLVTEMEEEELSAKVSPQLV